MFVNVGYAGFVMKINYKPQKTQKQVLSPHIHSHKRPSYERKSQRISQHKPHYPV